MSAEDAVSCTAGLVLLETVDATPGDDTLFGKSTHASRSRRDCYNNQYKFFFTNASNTDLLSKFSL